LEIRAYSAVLAYNDGATGMLQVLKAFDLNGKIIEI